MKINNKYSIWEKVELVSTNDKIIYMVYSIKVDYYWYISYTIWNNDDYLAVDEWQIKPYIPPTSIWLTTE